MSKAKNKKPGKSSKLDPKNLDLSELQKPIKISASSLKDAAKLLETGTPEVKSLLSHEVNLLYECRICRSIFRSLVNLISHKRIFCRQKYNGCGNRSREYENSINATTENLENSELDQITLDSFVNLSKNDRILRSQAPVKSNNKTDLTSVVHMLQKKQEGKLVDVSTENSELHTEETNCDQVVLQVLDSKRAAYQTLIQPNSSPVDLMENQVIELENILNQDSVVLRADGQFEKSDSPVQFYGDDESNRLVCEICSLTFTTQKTFDSHFRIKHAAVRDCYLCPCNSCTASFSSTMGVKRHLTNVHKKIGQELKTLSQQIEKRTVRSKPLTVVGNKKPKKPENFNNLVDNSLETQQWVESIDSQALHECISCGEIFNDKSELVIHLKNCLGSDEERINYLLYENDAELKENVINDTEIAEIPVLSLPDTKPNSPTRVMPEISSGKECLPIRVQAISRISEEEWSKIPSRTFQNEDITAEAPTKFNNNKERIICPKKTNKPSITEILPVENYLLDLEHSRKRKSAFSDINNTVIGEKLKKLTCQENETDKETAKKSQNQSSQHFSATLASISDHTKLECIACRLNFSNITSLNRHMEGHLKVNRFQCNKCDYKSTSRNDCVGHCNRVHNAMNNRQALNEMISQISQYQLTQSQGMITVDPSNLNSNSARQENSTSQLGNINSNTELMRTYNNVKINSEVRNPSDTDPELEDRETINRKIDSNPNLPELIQEIVVGKNSTSEASTSKVNGESRLENNHFRRIRNDEEINGYSSNFAATEFSNLFPSNKKSDPWNRENNLSPSSDSDESSCMVLRSSSRLSKKINTDDEEDEITCELYRGDSDSGKKRRKSSRSRSRSSMRSNSQMQVRSESRIMTRSRSRMENRMSEDNDDSFSQSMNTTRSENKSERSKSQAKKEETKEKKKRGRPRKNERRSAPAKINDKITEVSSTRRRESFSSENSQIQRPVRSRVKPVDKDFIYDLEDEDFLKSQNSNNFIENHHKSDLSKRIFTNNSDEELIVLQEFANHDSSAELENQERFFRGFPRQPEILNIE
ncbi:uncharacterized protein LOC122504260 [Leptopilina heterotoma]|uniref:uncharacterized protein LOC122504260 n=1 Tax=Leptopilina heterotoma TaxID=63436 RepID=UPI001CA9D370|nr:uncharacterized protein LOC122504260 [Leptopilina heterotoma]